MSKAVRFFPMKEHLLRRRFPPLRVVALKQETFASVWRHFWLS